jgi:hypothetical protein
MKARIICSLAASLGVTTGWAHHSMNKYDFAISKQLNGTISEAKWMNPHCVMQLLVKTVDGDAETWRIEYGTPNLNTRNGWRRDEIKSGDKVSVVIRPMKNGAHEGTLVSLQRPDGRLLYGQGASHVSER